MFCGEDSDEQNEVAELSWIFGGPEPDLEPPTVEIVAPEDGAVLEVGSDVDLRAIVDDDFGGYGWRFIIERDGEVVYDQVDYDKDVDAEYRAALNFINLETGTYVMTVEVEDHADNVSVDSVTITVEGPAGDTDDSNGSTGTIEGSTGDESGTSTSGTTTAPPDPPDPDPPDTDPADTETTGPVSIDGDGGCGCQTSAPPRPALAFFLLVLVTGARRRRSDS
jgi:MYXO-CTERM domain-containing protein